VILAIRAMLQWGDDWTVRGAAQHISLNQYAAAGTVELGYEPPLLLSDEPESMTIYSGQADLTQASPVILPDR
jgi:hypothetical protein